MICSADIVNLKTDILDKIGQIKYENKVKFAFGRKNIVFNAKISAC